jgi:hypothetical protein
VLLQMQYQCHSHPHSQSPPHFDLLYLEAPHLGEKEVPVLVAVEEEGEQQWVTPDFRSQMRIYAY